MTTRFEPTFESLYNYSAPDWFRDVKFGIWSHWGPQSVPMYGDWYARNMYIENSDQYRYHVRHYGHPSQFGYKDICALWKAERFDPDELMSLYYKAGARYFVAQATHHDHFFNYNSDVNRFNSVKVGPGKDICALWKAAAEKYNMPFGLTEHLAASFSWWHVNKGADKTGPYAGVPYDGNDPAYRDFYHDNFEHNEQNAPWLTPNKAFRAYWLRAVTEMIDRFTPDLLYSDSGLPFGEDDYSYGLEAVAHLYNKSIEKFGFNHAVYTQKDRNAQIFKVGTLDIEKSQLPGIQPDPWETDTCIGNWFYDVRQKYKQPGHIVEMLVDIISKNGTMLLNVLQKPDGTIDDWARWTLEEIASWYAVCSEGVYGTRPWKVFGEGDSRVVIDGFRESQVAWTASDYRFTAKGKDVYAFLMHAPDDRRAVVRSFRDEAVEKVALLGVGDVPFSQNYGILTVELPAELPTKYTNCLKITVR
ncbi:MAG: alpha-L-fucosidase [Clostridia bacterium]|nr:alpha-L-fucosidase [Clostridia bacterium]MBO7405621.1 alpha-L-fucosidase [Clostridia bacterium]